MALVKTYRHNHNSGKQLTLHWSCEAGTRLRGMAHLILFNPYHTLGIRYNLLSPDWLSKEHVLWDERN